MMNVVLENKKFFEVLFGVFVITEIVDLLLDSFLGVNVLHSLVQFGLYLFLFGFVVFYFDRFYRNRFDELLSEDLIEILKVVLNAEKRNIMLNQKKIMAILKVTKPTLKKRVEVLIGMGFLVVEERGNFKFLKLTARGKRVVL